MGATLTEAVAGVDGGAGGKRPWLSGGRKSFSVGKPVGAAEGWVIPADGFSGRAGCGPKSGKGAGRAKGRLFPRLPKGPGRRCMVQSPKATEKEMKRSMTVRLFIAQVGVGSATLTGTSL